MKSKTRWFCFATCLALVLPFFMMGCATPGSYTEVRDGNYLYINPFRHKPDSAAQHLAYAQSLSERGRTTRAAREFETLIRRWPGSPEAARARKESAELYYEQGRTRKAFEAYEDLVAGYFPELRNYDEVLERKLALADREAARRRMRWMFGGYRAPERAVDMYETILRNAPQWERAPEIQYRIGQVHEKAGNREEAVVAYSVVEFRYPDSPFAEQAALARVRMLFELVERTPYSVDLREEAQLAVRIFPQLYPQSEHLAEVQAMERELTARAARHAYETGRFYERIPRPAQSRAAAIYYRKAIEEYQETPYADRAAGRLRALLPVDRPDPVEIAEVTPETIDPDRPVRRPDERLPREEEAVDVTADRIEYVGDLLIAEGQVVILQRDARMEADRITLNQETGEVTASGNVRMIRDGAEWSGESLVYNYRTREGTFENSMMFFEPAYITAARVEQISTNEFLMTDAMITTCGFEDPPVYARARELRVVDKGDPSGVFIQARNVTFYVGPVPVFYTPVWQRHLGHRVFTTKVGYSNRLGGFILGSANLRPREWLHTSTHLDLYSKRGVGLGQDLHWFTPGGRGGIQSYYISDQSPYLRNYTPAERELIDSNRYRIKAHHREDFDEQTYLMARLHWVSDPGVIEEFFREEFRESAEPENVVVIQRSTETYALGLRADRRLNDFYTTVDRIPMVTYDRYRVRIGETPFFFESESSVAFLEKLHARMPGELREPDARSIRLDTYNQIFLPLRYNDWLNVIPRAGYRATWYSKTDRPGEDSGLRHLFDAGVLTSFKAWNHLTEKSGFFGDGLRHTFEPYVDYLYRAEPNLRAHELHTFDRVDLLDERNDVRFGMRNFLQTRRGATRLANFLDSDIYTSYRFDPQGTEREFGPLVAYAEMSLSENLYLQGDAEYDWHTSELTPANARLRWVTADQSVYSLGYRYRDDEIARRSLITASALLFPNSKWSYEFAVRYDGRDGGGWEDRSVIVRREFDCVGMGTGFVMDKDDDITVWIQFWLTALPGASIGLR